VQAAIFIAVIKISLYPLADQKPILIIDCYVARIKNTVNVASKKNSIREFMCAAECVWPDMSGVQCGKNLTSRNSTSPMVCVRDSYTKRSLT